MIEKILVILLPLIFLGTFIARNLIVKARTKQRVRASDPILTVSIIFTSLCIFMTIFSAYSEPWYQLMGAITLLRSNIISYVGLSLFAISIIMGWIFSAQLRDSWRVGVHDNQKTQLIQNGIYKYVRNPYFLSYFIMFWSLFLMRPSFVLIALVLITVTIFHRMVLKEEAYLLKIHETQYEQYMKTAGRYLPRFIKGHEL
jgi:protein-S-isoprenylcysteine O-methyltransferase Ste14